MGLTKVTTKLTSLNPPFSNFEEVFLVDTGVTDSMAPAKDLEKIGVEKKGKMSYELADGTIIQIIREIFSYFRRFVYRYYIFYFN